MGLKTILTRKKVEMKDRLKFRVWNKKYNKMTMDSWKAILKDRIQSLFKEG